MWDDILSRMFIELVSNIDRSKWDESNDPKETFLIGEKEASEFF